MCSPPGNMGDELLQHGSSTNSSQVNGTLSNGKLANGSHASGNLTNGTLANGSHANGAAAAGASGDSVRFKCSYGVEKRILFMRRPVRFEVLLARVASLFQRAVQMCCQDVGGGLADLMPIRSQAHLDAAVALFDAASTFSLQLFLTDDVQTPGSGEGMGVGVDASMGVASPPGGG